jgi:hypothetical protein
VVGESLPAEQEIIERPATSIICRWRWGLERGLCGAHWPGPSLGRPFRVLREMDVTDRLVRELNGADLDDGADGCSIIECRLRQM